MFIPFKINTGKQNMQIDSDLLDNAIKNQTKELVFRLYGWSPACVSLGRNQKDDFVDEELLETCGIDIVRRLTGGRALLHDDEITYSYVCPAASLKNGENVVESYKEISQILINAFAQIGIELELGGKRKLQGHKDYCMLVSTGADLCWHGRKLIGSAQFRKEGYILQHGSILYSYNRDLLERIFKEKVDTSSIVSVKEINPNLTKQEIISLLSNVKL